MKKVARNCLGADANPMLVRHGVRFSDAIVVGAKFLDAFRLAFQRDDAEVVATHYLHDGRM